MDFLVDFLVQFDDSAVTLRFRENSSDIR